MKFKTIILIAILSLVLFSCGSGNKSDQPNEQNNADISDSDNQEDPVDQDCINGSYRCLGNMVQKCDEEKWQNVQKCADDRVCNEETGKCDIKSTEIDDSDDNSNATDPNNDSDSNSDTEKDDNDTNSETTDEDSGCIEGSVKCHSPFVSYICQNDEWKHYKECPDDETCNDETGKCEPEIGSTRITDCSNLPENAEWNGVSSITQTWNGTEWEPSSTGIYDTNSSSNKCRFKCKNNYTWNGSSCISYNDQPVKTLSMICTGQTKCYDQIKEIDCPTSPSENYYGQDAQYAQLGYCISKSFTIKTISNQKIIVDNNLGIEWQGIVTTNEYNWTDAISYCENLTYAGSSDWRLPTSQEFIAIDDFSKDLGCPFNTTYFSQIESAAHNLWTLDHANDEEYVFEFAPHSGGIQKASDSDLRKLICVRGNKLSTPILDTLTIDSENVLIDSISGLMWQDFSKKLPWAAALSYCENLTYAGFSDWRLPNINELSSLFPNMFSTGEEFWSSTTMPENYTWSIWSNLGITPYKATSTSISVRCVRNQ